jgi:MinD-like ATPase involved in chromosome partitioning or flagellar assembly
MLTACWSVKGGSGTTTIAAALTMALAHHGRSVVAADFAGDLPVALGLPSPTGPGLRDWLDAGAQVPADGLARIAQREGAITVVPRGAWSTGAGRADTEAAARLATALCALPPGGPVVADCGLATSPGLRAFVDAADRSLLVVRACYLALRRAVDAPRPTAIVVVREPGRSLSPTDIEDTLGVPIATVVDWDPQVAHAVDTGLLRTRLPRRVVQSLRSVAA